MPAIPRQRRYDQVMGDREPKVTDKRFVLELQHRLEDKYVTTQCQKEKKLAEAENRRIRKLVLDGVIDAEDSHRGQAVNDRDHEWKEFWPQNPRKSLAEYEEDKKRKAEETSRGNHQHAQEAETHRSQPEAATTTESHAAPAEPAGSGGGRGVGGGGDTSGRAPAVVGRYDASQSPRIDDLRVEENLDELYRKASGIVYVMSPPVKAAKAKPKH